MKLLLIVKKNAIYNRLSKITYFEVIIEKISVKKLVRLFRNNIQKLYSITNFIQLVSPQLVDQFSQTKLCQKALNEDYC